MCVAVPGRVLTVTQASTPFRPGLVEFGTGVIQEVDLAMVPDAGVGDYVITHSGFAIRKVSEESALDAYRRLQHLSSCAADA